MTTRSIERPRRVFELWACGWCKGFVHEEKVSKMSRYVHDEPPITNHEVLPFRVKRGS